MSYADWMKTYGERGMREVEGWFNSQLFTSLLRLHEIQEGLKVRGGIVEIGVHHGRFFMPLNGMVAEGEGTSYAIDIFEDQMLNIDRSGSGNKTKFEENLQRHDRHAGANVVCIKADSTRLDATQLALLQKARPKVISIDGGHTAEHTLSDLTLAASIVHEGGAVFVDDILSADWIGVIEGVVLYLQRRPTLWPVLIGYNKMMLVPMSVHEHYLKEFRNSFAKARLVTLCGYRMFSHRNE